MSLAPYLFSNFENVFDTMLSNDFSLNHRSYHSNMPVDILETKTNVVVRVTVPGLQKENMHVSVDENKMLTIQATYESRHKDNNNPTYHRFESSHGTVKRTVRLPRLTDTSTESLANLKNGVLEITFNKVTRPDSGRRINIV
jgi:HSP20 family protein